MPLGSIYISQSGMTSYAQGLDVISNNVANLNTPGFKLGVPLFRDLIYRDGSSPLPGAADAPVAGAGLTVDTTRQSFRQGELRETGNPLDVAIDGSGLFVLEVNSEKRYTRAGQFQFDDDGVLVERQTGWVVVVSTDEAAETTFDVDPFRSLAPEATSEVQIAGNLSRSSPDAAFDLNNVSVVDSAGGRQTLRARFVRSATDPLQWAVEVFDANSASVGAGALAFKSDGGGVVATVAPPGLSSTSVRLLFGTPGSFGGTTSVVSTAPSSLQVRDQDGFEVGSLTEVSFTQRGELTLTYSNGETRSPAALVLAQVNSPDQLRPLGAGVFGLREGAQVDLGAALTEGRGQIAGGRIELSNVELTEQFTDLIIIQRGYQGSSQLASVANEMIQQLLQIDARS
jgi:flagellar hook protein FlgE